MKILLSIMGTIILAYWVYHTSQKQHNQPRIIVENGGVIIKSGV